MALTKLTITIKKEDILADNYTDSQVCPITKALARAGRPDLIECVGIYKRNAQGYSGVPVLANDEYHGLMVKLYSMYASFPTTHSYDNYGHEKITPIEPADFDYTIEFEE